MTCEDQSMCLINETLLFSARNLTEQICMDSMERCESSASPSENSYLLPTRPTIQNGRREFSCRSLLNVTCLKYFSFVVIVLWQLFGSALYLIRAYYCCMKERHTTFRCSNFATFRHSQELELAWLISLSACIVAFAIFLRKIPEFLGYSAIFRKAVRLPTFWTLTMLKIIEVIGFGVIIYFNKLSTLQICLIASFCALGTVLIFIVCVLNFTPVNLVRSSSGSLVLAFYKLTLLILSEQIFVIFLIGSVQFAFKVTGLDDVGRSANFVTVFRKLREFPQVVFYYKMSAFLFHKLFMDNNSILSHCQRLRIRE